MLETGSKLENIKNQVYPYVISFSVFHIYPSNQDQLIRKPFY